MLLNAWVVLIFVAYFAVLLGIALVRARRMQGMADYVLGSRQLSAFASALSASSSSASGGSMLAAPALVYIEGGMVVWIFLIIWVATLLSWVVLAGRLRRYTVAAGDSLTIPAFLENRFEDRTGGLRTISAVVSLFFITIYIASGLVGGAKLLETTLGMDPVFGILVTLVAVASYTFIGGFMAVSRTDVFQALLMLGAFMVVSLTLLGVTENPLGELLAGEGAYLNPFNDAEGNSLSWVFILSVAGWGVPAWGFTASVAAIHGGGVREQDTGQPQHRHCLVGADLGLYLAPWLDGKACLGAGRYAQRYSGPRTNLFRRGWRILPPAGGRPSAHGCRRSGDEHSRFAAIACLGYGH